MPNSVAAATVVLYIKHIVCPRGIRVVRQELESLGLRVLAVLGCGHRGSAARRSPGLGPAARSAGGCPLRPGRKSPSRDFVSCVQNKVAELLGRQPAPRLRAFMAVLAQEVNLRPAHLNATFAG